MAFRAAIAGAAALALVAPAGAQAGLEQLHGVPVSWYGIGAVTVGNRLGDGAVLWHSGRGIGVAIARRGRFSRPRVIAGSERALEIAGALGHRGDLLAVWTVNDHSIHGDPSLREDDCCERLHAAVIRRDGRVWGPFRLTHSGPPVFRVAAATGPGGRLAIAYWRSPNRIGLRTGRIGRRWNRAQTVVASAPTRAADLVAVGFSGTRAAVQYLRSDVILHTAVLAERAQGADGRIGAERTVFDGGLGISRIAPTLAGAVSLGNVDRQPRLLEHRTGRALRTFPLAAAWYRGLTAAPNGAACLWTDAGRASIRVQARAPGSSLTQPRLLRLVGRGHDLGPYSSDQIAVGVTAAGTPIALGVEQHRRRADIWVSSPQHGPRRVGSLRGRVSVLDVSVPVLGRPRLLVEARRRLYVVRG